MSSEVAIFAAIVLVTWAAFLYVASLIFSGFAFVAFVILWSAEMAARKLWSLT